MSKPGQKKRARGETNEPKSTKMASAPEPVDVTVGSPAFQTMNEPETVDVGHFIFLRCGHNGHFLDSEKKVFMEHLVKGGMMDERDSQRCSLMSSGTAEKARIPGKARDSEAAARESYNLESDAESTAAMHGP